MASDILLVWEAAGGRLEKSNGLGRNFPTIRRVLGVIVDPRQPGAATWPQMVRTVSVRLSLLGSGVVVFHWCSLDRGYPYVFFFVLIFFRS